MWTQKQDSEAEQLKAINSLLGKKFNGSYTLRVTTGQGYYSKAGEVSDW